MARLRRFFNLFRQERLRGEFDDELRFHLETRIDANVRAGMNRQDAEQQARREMGSMVSVREGMREARLLAWIDTLARDLRHGARLLLRQPVLSSLAVLTLSLGIGANATVFSLLNAALLRPLPFAESDRLIAIVDGFRTDGATGVPPTVPELIDVRKAAQSLDALSFYDTRDFQITGGNEPERVFAARVEASFLSVLGARPAHGRLFRDGENLPGSEPVVILSNSLWQRNFGGDPGIVGRQIIVNGEASRVVGVLPVDFSFDYASPERIEMYVPFLMNDVYTLRSSPFTNVRRVSAVARLKAGYSIQSAAAELQTISLRLASEYPALYRRGSDSQDTGFYMTAMPLHEYVTRPNHSMLALLFAAVVVVLLIACVNTTQFLLSRSMERQAEIAVRSALGASRRRLFAQFLSEVMIIGAAGGAIGLLQAYWLTKALAAVLPARVPLAVVGEIEVDGMVLAFTTAAALIAVIACAFIPAIRFSSHDPAPAMAGRGVVAGRARSRQVLIAIEVALSALLLVFAGLVTRSLLELQNAPAGYSADGVLVMQMRLGPRALAARNRFAEAVAAIPGVDSAALADWPLPVGTNTDFAIEGGSTDAATLSRQLASYRIVSPEYFSTVRIPFLEGRSFTNDDATGRPAVAIVNEDMARRFWSGQSAIGRRVRAGPGPRNAVLTIVGVVEDVRPPSQAAATPQIYVPSLQQEEPNRTLIVRSATGAMVSMESIKKAIWSVVPDQPVFNIRPLSEVAAQPLADRRTISVLLGSFAALAVFMSVIGVFTVVSYVISRRTKEIAIRMAIGARSLNVLAAVAGQTLCWTGIALSLGVLAAAGIGRAFSGMVGEMARPDTPTIALVGGLYFVVVAAAICLPVLRALRTDPANILRVE